MTAIELRVELPAYSQTFQIQADSQWSVKEVKAEIQRACKGSPRVDGQRLIWRGRFLRDEESVKEIWKSVDDARIVHLSVHPSAWTESPPTGGEVQRLAVPHVTSAAPLSAPPQPLPTPHHQAAAVSSRTHSQPAPSANPSPFLSYIHQKHNTAIHVLTNGSLPPPSPLDISQADTIYRAYALYTMQMYGYTWPTILDEEYPTTSENEQAVKYEQSTIDNQPYLSLVTPNGIPSAIQQHALKVLSCTFPLLSLTPPEPTLFQPPQQYNATYQLPTVNLNQQLQQLGFPGLRVAPGQNVNQNPADPNNLVAIEVRAVPFRALMVPLMMLLFRTFLLVYFFSPSKRPVFGLILSAWIFYEAWGALRGILGGDRPNNNAAEQGRAANGDAGAGAEQGQRAQDQGGAAVANNNTQQTGSRRLTDRVIENLAAAGLDREETVLNGLNIPPPTLTIRIRAFFHLFFSTLHPAVWDRRRSTLRKREGRLRTEANIRQSPEVDESTDPDRHRSRRQMIDRHRRRAPWVQTYVERVLNTEFADDA